MRPLTGVVLEVLALSAFLTLAPFAPRGLPFALYVVLAQLVATYLVHCPAHYFVGSATGIGFRSIHFGRTTLTRVLPKRAAGIARLLPVLFLSTERSSLARASRRRAASMYASGTVASCASAVMIALVATWAELPVYSALAWGVAAAYILFDVVFSPRSGDLMRARAALAA